MIGKTFWTAHVIVLFTGLLNENLVVVENKDIRHFNSLTSFSFISRTIIGKD